MLNLALWLKKNDYQCDQVQNFYPSPMCNATAMYHSETNPLKRVKYKKREDLFVAKGERQRRLHKALLRYHDPLNWPLIREALVNMGKKHLIGDRANCLVPAEGSEAEMTPAERRGSGRHGAKRFATKHPNQPDIRKDGKRGTGGNHKPAGTGAGKGKPGQRATGGKPAGQGKPHGNGNQSSRNGNNGANGNAGNRPQRNGSRPAGAKGQGARSQGGQQRSGGKPSPSRAR